MRILLLKSLLLCTNCPSFLPILCGFLLFLPWICFCFCRGCLFISAVESFCFAVESFLFLPWICFCRGFVFDLILTFSVSAVESFLFLSWIPLCIFLLVFVFSSLLFSLVPSIISHEIRKTWEFF